LPQQLILPVIQGDARHRIITVSIIVTVIGHGPIPVHALEMTVALAQMEVVDALEATVTHVRKTTVIHVREATAHVMEAAVIPDQEIQTLPQTRAREVTAITGLETQIRPR
jgi:hypothetical protein